jgi:hypothetical protein
MKYQKDGENPPNDSRRSAEMKEAHKKSNEIRDLICRCKDPSDSASSSCRSCSLISSLNFAYDPEFRHFVCKYYPDEYLSIGGLMAHITKTPSEAARKKVKCLGHVDCFRNVMHNKSCKVVVSGSIGNLQHFLHL